MSRIGRLPVPVPSGVEVTIDGQAVATGVNDIVHSHDPTTHAEMEAVRAAARKLGRPDLRGSVVYASGHPCPMCLAAMTMAGVQAVYYAFDNNDAAPYGLSSEAAYQALRLPGGHTLVSLGPSGRIVEIDRAGLVVRRYDMTAQHGLERGWIAGITAQPDGTVTYSDSRHDRLVALHWPTGTLTGIFQNRDVLLHPSTHLLVA